MRIFWQSFVDESVNSNYIKRLGAYLNSIATTDTTVTVCGISPPDRDFGRLSELRCAISAIGNGLQAEDDGYDAYVLGHFQDPGLYELRSALRIPVIGAGEATLFAAAQLGRRIGLITISDEFLNWHREQGDLYGLGNRVEFVAGMACDPADFSDAFSGDKAAKQRMLDDFSACALPLVKAGADVIVPAGVLPGLLFAEERGFLVDHAPVLNCASVALKSAEMWVQLQQLDGIEPNRKTSFPLAPKRAREDFRNLVNKAFS